MVGIHPILMKNNYTKYKYYPEDNKMYIPGIIEYHHTSNELNILEPSNQDYQEESGV